MNEDWGVLVVGCAQRRGGGFCVSVCKSVGGAGEGGAFSVKVDIKIRSLCFEHLFKTIEFNACRPLDKTCGCL